MNENQIYSLAVDLAVDDMGIYAKSIVDSDGSKKNRTEYQDGWNACIMKIVDKAGNISGWLDNLPKEVLLLVADEKIRVSVNSKERLKTWVLCNDLFYWACADGEDFELSDLSDFQKALKESPDHGDLLWCCRKRKMRPQTPYYQYFNDEEKTLFNACGPERDPKEQG